MKKRDSLIPCEMWLPLTATLACNALAYYGSRLLTDGRYHYDLTNPVDARIPLVPWTVFIYFGCYLFWIVNYVIGCRQDREEAFRFLSADFAAKLICLFCFVLFPTTNVRPQIMGTSLWDECMRILYQIDAADNLFPSIHCLTSWFCVLAVWKNQQVPRWYQYVSVLIAISIFLSTLTTKQHVLIDVFAGVALAQLSFMFVARTRYYKWYKKIFEQMNKRVWKGQ